MLLPSITIRHSSTGCSRIATGTENPVRVTTEKDHYTLPPLNPEVPGGRNKTRTLAATENRGQKPSNDDHKLPPLQSHSLPVLHISDHRDWEGQNRRTIQGINLCDVNLYMRTYPNSNLNRADMTGACACRSNMRGSSMLGVECRGTDFVQADLRDCDMRGSNLAGSNCRFADLRGTDLRGCCIWGADFSEAITDSRTCFEDVSYDQYTIFPEGYEPPHSAIFVDSQFPPEHWGNGKERAMFYGVRTWIKPDRN